MGKYIESTNLRRIISSLTNMMGIGTLLRTRVRDKTKPIKSLGDKYSLKGATVTAVLWFVEILFFSTFRNVMLLVLPR